MRIEVIQVVKAPREKVWQVGTDYEGMPGWSTVFTSVKVTKRQGNTVHTESEGKILGRKVKTTEKHTLTPPAREESEGESDGSKARIVTTYDPVPEGTKMTWMADFEFKGVLAKLFGPFAKRRVQALLRKDVQAFAKYVEARK